MRGASLSSFCFLLFCLFACTTVLPSPAYAAPPTIQSADALHAPPLTYDTQQSYFTVLGSFRTARGAMTHLANLRHRQPSTPLAVYPPRAHGRYWIVVAASYASFSDAHALARASKANRLQRDAYVWHLPLQANGSLLAYGPSVAPKTLPRLLLPAAAGTSGTFVIVRQADDEASIRPMAAALRKTYPNLAIVVLPPRAGETKWRIALATNLGDADVESAVTLARRLGLAEQAEVIRLDASEAAAWLPNDPDLFASALRLQKRVEQCFRDGSISIGQMQACAGVWITPETLRTCLGASTSEKQLSLATLDACIPLPNTTEINAVLASLNYNEATALELAVSTYDKVEHVDVLMQCAAEAKDALTLQRCAIPSMFSADQQAALNCLRAGGDFDVASCIASATGNTATQQQLACLKGKQLSLATVAACSNDPAMAARAARVQTCLQSFPAVDDQRRCLAQFGPSEVQLKRAQCLKLRDTRAAAECAISVDPQGAELLKKKACIESNRSNPAGLAKCVIDDVGQSGAAMLACYSSSIQGTALGECLAKQDDRLKRVTELATCASNNSSDAQAMLVSCASGFVPGDDVQLATCLLKNHVSTLAAASACNIVGGDAERALKIANCASVSESKPSSLARCVVSDLPNSTADLELALCLKDSGGDPKRTAICAAPRIGGAGGAVARCLAANPDSDPLRCVSAADPSLQTAQRLYNCVSQGTSTTAVIAGCTQGLVDAKTAQAVTCVSEAGGDSGAIAACAGQALLPGEAGRLAGCAASSQGGPTAFALCAAGPKMNAEWRIAAECAVSSGGNPVGFATCTGGRLTLRELSKCLGGKIGEDCFGPNNTIRKFYEGMWNDLVHGPGPNNEIVKGVKAVGEGIEHLGNEVKKEVADRLDRARNRLDRPFEKPGKTAECILTFGNSCG